MSDRLHPQTVETLRQLVLLHGADKLIETIRQLPDKAFRVVDRKHVPLERRKQVVYAVMTGERRAPRKGEWFISGAIPEAYYAVNDLSQVYPIAKLVWP